MEQARRNARSCKHFMLANYDSRVVLTGKLPILSRVVIYERKMFYRIDHCSHNWYPILTSHFGRPKLWQGSVRIVVGLPS